MDNQTILSIRDLRVVFEDGFTALGGVSIDIGENEFVTLLGPSGCGKTTLLRCIGGFEKPTSGEILYKGPTSSVCRRISARSTPCFSATRSSRI